MAEGTQLSMTDDGHLAVIKRAPAGPGADRLSREASILERAAHPGVVELLAVGDLDGGVELRTAFVGGGTLAEHLGTFEGVEVVAALATTLADLHDRGIAHRRVTADHVLVTDADQVRVCGFADAVVSDAGACDAEAAAADVEAVATLVREIAGSSTGADSAGLRTVTDRVLLAEPLARPSMRTLAQALGALAHASAPSTPPVATGRRILAARPPAPSRRLRPPQGRTAMAVAVVAVVVLVGFTVVAITSGPAPSSSQVAAPPPAPAPPGTSADTSTSEPLGARAWPTVPPPNPRPRPAGAEVADGIVSSSGRRWQVASPDDLVVVGDWDCDGLATPAVVRHGTGHVWTYASWAEGTEGVVADAAGQVPGATSATAVTVGTCDHLEVTDTAGTTTRLDLST